MFVASTHNYMMFFTETGRCYWLRVFEIPEGSRQAKGRAIQNLIQIEKEDKVKAFITVPNLKDEELLDSANIIMCTRKGVIKKTSLRAYSRPRSSGIIAININEGDELIEAKLTEGDDEVLMAIASGRAIRFHESHVRQMGRNSTGVRGIRLGSEEDEVVGMVIVKNQEADILVVSENGFGKRSKVAGYRETNRGGKGIKTIQRTEKTGDLISIKNVLEGGDLMIITRKGITIRMSVEDIREDGRATQGVRLIKLRKGDMIAAIAKVAEEEDEEEILGEDGLVVEGGAEGAVAAEGTDVEPTTGGDEEE